MKKKTQNQIFHVLNMEVWRKESRSSCDVNFVARGLGGGASAVSPTPILLYITPFPVYNTLPAIYFILYNNFLPKM